MEIGYCAEFEGANEHHTGQGSGTPSASIQSVDVTAFSLKSNMLITWDRKYNLKLVNYWVWKRAMLIFANKLDVTLMCI